MIQTNYDGILAEQRAAGHEGLVRVLRGGD
jgi:hypothetical protein